jgi:hypothetical protein
MNDFINTQFAPAKREAFHNGIAHEYELLLIMRSTNNVQPRKCRPLKVLLCGSNTEPSNDHLPTNIKFCIEPECDLVVQCSFCFLIFWVSRAIEPLIWE